MEVGAKLWPFSVRKNAKSIVFLSAIFWLTAASEVLEVTTKGFEFPTYETTTNVTESPNDNGMAIGDIPRDITPTTTPSAPQSKEEEPSAVDVQPLLVSFPENHKNFTPSQYLGEQDFPPYHNHLNSYQQQYKKYYEQKEIYSRKPIKFEENSLKNYYLPPNPNSLPSGGDKTSESVRVNRNPFPYAFENEHNHENWYTGQEQTRLEKEKYAEGWYQNLGHQSYQVNEKNPEGWHKHPPASNDHVLRGHKETFAPYYIFPHGYHHEEKLYKNEPLQFDEHHHVQKEEKGNPWKKVFHALTALVPLGLLLASLTPNVISINSTATTKTTRQRSEDPSPLRFKEEDVFKAMRKYGIESVTEGQCEDKMICELATEGGKTSAGPIEKGFWFLANQTPWDVAEKAGMNDLFKAIRTGNCDVYKCHTRAALGKKLIRKHKTAK